MNGYPAGAERYGRSEGLVGRLVPVAGVAVLSAGFARLARSEVARGLAQKRLVPGGIPGPKPADFLDEQPFSGRSCFSTCVATLFPIESSAKRGVAREKHGFFGFARYHRPGGGFCR